jgi:GT2 family glycosyltransferase
VTAPESPLLSIVITGRNDDYGGDFNARFFRALGFNHDKLAARAVPHEVVFVEWDPVPGKRLLVEEIEAALPGVAREVLVAYVADARYQEACTQNPRLGFLEFLAKNVGIRRARGRFILTTNTDVFLGPELIDRFAAAALEPGVVYRTNRIDVKFGIDESHLTWEILADARNHVPRPPIAPPLYQGAAGDFVLLDRESFHRLGGYNEVYRLARLGPDHNFLVKALSSGLRIEDIGAPVYHVSHLGSYQISKGVYGDVEREARWGKLHWHAHDVIYDNPETWGLAEAPVTTLAPDRFRLEFDWAAVPKLADLRRIVLPPARTGT